MRSTLFAAAVALLAYFTHALDTDRCPKCSDVTISGVVCASSASGKRREFPSLCAMEKTNCLAGSQAWLEPSAGACVNLQSKLWRAQSFSALPRAQPQCASCTNSAVSAVCGRNTQGRMLTFVNTCWLDRNNCLKPALTYSLVAAGYCPTALAQTTATLGTTFGTGDGMAAHPNAKLINTADCGLLPIGSKVFNGLDAGLFQFPWVVHMTISEAARGQTYTCGGSVISARYILTAAHCVSGHQTPVRLSMRVGDYVLSTATDCATVSGRVTCAPPAQTLDVEQVLVHPLYNNTIYGYDLALVRLRQAIFFGTAAVKPVCLPLGAREEGRTFAGESMSVIGWGITASGRPADTLQAATVPAVSNVACQQAYGSSARILPSQVCAGGNARDSCAGDSGAPLMFPMLTGTRLAEYGIVSYGVECGGSNPPPGVYTRVGAHMAWLLDNMRV